MNPPPFLFVLNTVGGEAITARIRYVHYRRAKDEEAGNEDVWFDGRSGYQRGSRADWGAGCGPVRAGQQQQRKTPNSKNKS